MRLKDKVVLVTASTRGIGLAIVKKAVQEGAIVYMAARNLEKANEIAQQLNQEGARVHTVYNDATVLDSYRTMVDEVVAQQGRLDVLVNNFGTSDPRKDLDIETTDYEDFKNTVDINLASVFISSQAAVKVMKQNGGGSIVNISSIGGIVPDISRVAYATSKAAINYLTRNMALQLGRSNIRVNAVAPGMTSTDAVMDNMSEQFQAFFTRHTPIRRMATPEEIANAVIYFASDEAAFTTGQIISVNGGFGDATPVFADLVDMKANERH